MTTSFDLMDALQEDITNVFCENCPAQSILRGATESGLAIEPDENTCPAEFDVDSPLCIKNAYTREIAEELTRIEEIIEEARSVENCKCCF